MNARQRSFSVQHAPEWGIEPVPPELRRLGLLDQAVLWGNLGVSLLVLVAGALLVPALGLWPALAATVVGAVVGNALLGLAAVPAAATGVPAMVLYRAPLGVRGSLLPTACNVVQNLLGHLRAVRDRHRRHRHLRAGLRRRRPAAVGAGLRCPGHRHGRGRPADRAAPLAPAGSRSGPCSPPPATSPGTP